MVTMEALGHRDICLKRLGLESSQKDVPGELLVAALADLEADDRDTTGVRDWFRKHGVHLPESAQVPYRRRSNNQKSAETEEVIRDLLNKGWIKTAIAKHLKVNHRVVIHVAREAQSAQNAENDASNDLGKK